MEALMRNEVMAHTAQITNQSVIDAVDAAFKQGRPYRDHWTYYMNPEQRAEFCNHLNSFEGACAVRYRWLVS